MPQIEENQVKSQKNQEDVEENDDYQTYEFTVNNMNAEVTDQIYNRSEPGSDMQTQLLNRLAGKYSGVTSESNTGNGGMILGGLFNHQEMRANQDVLGNYQGGPLM